MLAVQADGSEIADDRRARSRRTSSHPLQQAFRERHSFQCGFCTPGFVMSTYAFLQDNPDPTPEADPRRRRLESLPLHRLPEHRRGREPGRARAPGEGNSMTTAMIGKLVGGSVERVEDGRILIGRGRYVDDVVLPGMVHAAFVRSPLAHARDRLRGRRGRARSLPGVIAVYTAADLEGVAKPLDFDFDRQAIARLSTRRSPRDKVRFVGDPIVLVVAEVALRR